MSKKRRPVLGFGPPQRRHVAIENTDKDGKPLGHYRCVTCLREAADA